MQPGDRVLIRQGSGALEHWIYATVFTARDDNAALVTVDHPGNFEHGLAKTVKREDIRVKADLAPLLEEAQTIADRKERKRWVEHYQHQIDQLD